MKKYITYNIIAAAIVLAASCAEEHIGPDSSDGAITLRLQTSEMETRAIVPGEGIENTVTHADFFFFSDSEGTNLLNHTRLSVGDGGLVSSGTNIYEYTFDVSDEGNPLQKASYVYVIANYPETIEATRLSDILGLDINIDLSGSYSSFVMDSYDSTSEGRLTYLSPSKVADSKTYTIGLTRAAAKLVLNINVKDEFEDEANNIWTPVTNQMMINFVNARKVAKVAAEPVAFDEKAKYYATSQVAPTSVESTKTGYTSWTHEAVYTYPQQYLTSDVTAPYYKIFIPWRCEKKGQNNFYYKIILPNLPSFQRNKIYKLTVDVSVIGGTEDDWALVTDNIYVADWWAPEKVESSIEGAMYLDVPIKYYEIYGVDYIDVPVISSNDIEVVNVTGTKQNLYGTNGNGVPYNVSVTPSIAINEDGKSGFRLTHVLGKDITSANFDCTPISYNLIVRHKEGGLTKTIPVTIVQYPSIYAERDPSNGYAYVNSYSHRDVSGGRHSTNYTYSNYAFNSRGDNANSSDALGVMNWLGQSSSQNNNGNQYVVYVSVLPSGYRVAGMSEDVVIGDPRGGELTNNYLGYYGNGANGTVTRDVQSKYNAVSSSTQNVIAPALRIASSWGATTTISYTDRAEERCAAYQENGYPAGRWRVPTIAEIDFLIQLSTYEHIPALFTTSKGTSGGYSRYSGYWANGPAVYLGKPFTDDGNTAPYMANSSLTVTNIQSNGGYLLRSGTSNANYRYYEPHVRCVYDEWYWGSEKYGNNGQVSTTAATQWLGYIF